jgi:hypothetical protein
VVTIPTRRQIKREVRNLKHFRESDFISDLQNMPWHEIESTKDPNLAWKKWESSLNKVLNRHAHAPLVHKRVRSSSLPWLSLILLLNDKCTLVIIIKNNLLSNV